MSTTPDESTHGPAAGWHLDPSRRHQYRYWNQATWTDHVADNGVAGNDPLEAIFAAVVPRATRPEPGHGVRLPSGVSTVLATMAAVAGVLALRLADTYRPLADGGGFEILFLGIFLTAIGSTAVFMVVAGSVWFSRWYRRRHRLNRAEKAMLVAPLLFGCLAGALVATSALRLAQAFAYVDRISDNPPLAITEGPDAKLWFTADSAIGTISTTGKVALFTDARLSGLGGIAAGPDGNLWFTGGSDPFAYPSDSGDAFIGRITTTGSITTFTDPTQTISNPDAITAGADGNLWFTSDDRIGRITTDGTITSFEDPAINSPTSITAGPDGNVWFTGSRRIARITPDGTITNFELPRRDGKPAEITAGADGNLWFTTGHRVGRVTTAGHVTVFPNHTGKTLEPRAIIVGSDGNLWFTSSHEFDYDFIFAASVEYRDNLIGRVTPSGRITLFTDSNVYDPESITEGPDDNVWFTSSLDNRIGKVTPRGAITTFPAKSLPR